MRIRCGYVWVSIRVWVCVGENQVWVCLGGDQGVGMCG